MSRPSSSAPNSIPRLLQQLSRGNARDALQAAKALTDLATAGPSEALRLAQCGAVPALVQAIRSSNAAVAAEASAALIAVGREAPGLVADAASSALVDALRRQDSGLAARAAELLCAIAERNSERVAAAPGALQALCSALCGTAVDTVHSAALALFACANASPGIARLVADTPGSLAALVALIASSTNPAHCALHTLSLIAMAGADLAARVISTPGAPQALAQAALQRGHVAVAECAAAVLAEAVKAGPEHASTIATPDVVAALVSGLGRAGVGRNCMGALCNLAGASPVLALRVSDAPGAEAALLAALTSCKLRFATNAALTLVSITRTDAADQRIARLLSGPEVPPALARLLQSNDAAVVEAITIFLAQLENRGVQMLARLSPLPGTVLQAWTAMLGGGEASPANSAGLVLHGLARAGADEARRVMSTPGFAQAVASAFSHSDTAVVTNALAVLAAVAAAGPALAARVATIAEVFPALLRSVQSSEALCAQNAACVLASVCNADAELARRAVFTPGVLRALVAMLKRGPSDGYAINAANALASMAGGVDGLRPDLAARLAAEDGLLLALAAFAQQCSSMHAVTAGLALAAIVACTTPGGGDLASLVGRTEGAIPALVCALREWDRSSEALDALGALRDIAAASPQDLGLRVLEAGAAGAAVAAVAHTHGGHTPRQAAVVADPSATIELADYAAALLEMLAALDAAAVTAALAGLLAPGGTAASAFARGLLAAAPLLLGPVAIKALARQAEAAAEARAQAAALEALAAASAAEAAATRPRLCAACGVQGKAAGAVRLRPCGACSGKGPAGRVLYCGAGCQRAHWPVHKAYCKQAAAAVAAAADVNGTALGGAA